MRAWTLLPAQASWTHPAAQQRLSEIAGDGIFAREDLLGGTIVARLHGRIADDVALRGLLADAATEGGYVVIMNDDDQKCGSELCRGSLSDVDCMDPE